MTTYYGIWSGKKWAPCGKGIFRTRIVSLARAQASIANQLREENDLVPVWIWKARAIGEDGLPTSEPALTEEQKEIRSEAASHKCTICGDLATNWVEMRDREWYFCDRHEAWGRYVLSDHLRRRPPKGPPTVWVSMEPFCPDCNAWLEVAKEVHRLRCPGCGKTFRDTEAPRRGGKTREKEGP